jgi:protein SCO1/2
VARMLAQKPIALQSGTWLGQARPLARFALQDFDGYPYDNASLDGHPSLLFFGYTNCPDICPATLAILSEMLRQAPLPGLKILFITVDPDRDTPAVLKQYLGSFDNEIIGLSAGRDALVPLMRSVAAAVERDTRADGSYQLNHSATLYLLDTRGRLAAVFSPPLAAAALSADLRTLAASALL